MSSDRLKSILGILKITFLCENINWNYYDYSFFYFVVTLSNGNHIVYDLNGRPEVTLEGYLTERHDKNWHIVCEEDMSIHQQEESASHICRYLGFR